MVYRAGILFCAIATALAAADGSQLLELDKPEGTGTQILKPRDLKELSHKNFNELLSKALTEGPKSAAELPRKFASRRQVCSIPLLEAPIDRSKHFSMKTIPTGPRSFDGTAVPNPAPACKDWQSGH
ncbi:MAG: hypothetical protein M3Y24_05020 [Acidobacteriota bacterium]|nr:hypothetical protein [Acidobacteriota bacterium]